MAMRWLTYSEGAFRAKLDEIRGLSRLLDAARELYALMRSPDTPAWVRAACVAALAYLILPADASPDFIPVLGHADDLAVLTAAIAAIAAQLGKERASAASRSG
jgi:uncharacterized membrane protein YkvA (DUF1232 family)